MRVRGFQLDLEWIRRDLNEEADALSNFQFEAFEATNRIKVVPSLLPWIVLPELMEESHRMFLEQQGTGAQRKPRDHPWPEAGTRKRLRQSDPWL